MATKWLLAAPVVGAVALGVSLGVGADRLLGAGAGADAAAR